MPRRYIHYLNILGVTGDGRMMAELLRDLGARNLYISGLATDHCVLCTTRDALQKGFGVTVLTDAVARVDIVPGESDCAINEMKNAGAQLVTVDCLQSAPGLELPEQ